MIVNKVSLYGNINNIHNYLIRVETVLISIIDHHNIL